MIPIQEILKRLPHRYPFILVDRILALEPKKSLQAIKNVTMNEEFFNGHFPGRPVMPGVLMLEALAQACALLAFYSYPEEVEHGHLFLLAGIGETRFRRIVEPGDQLQLDVEWLGNRHQVLKCKGVASVAGEAACITTITSVQRKMEINA